MPTAASWTDALGAARDLGFVVRFRIATVRRPAALALAAIALGLITLAAATLPARADAGIEQAAYTHDIVVLLPTALTGFLIVAIAAAVASGGGRELLERDAASIHPISTTTDHFGALLVAPLNLVWLLQAWTLLAAAAYALPTWSTILPAQLGIGLWLLVATAIGQLMAWCVEASRRTAHGVVAVRILLMALAVVVTWLQLTHRLSDLLDGLPTGWLMRGLVDGVGWSWGLRVGLEAAVFIVAVALGALPARVAVRRTPREELRIDSGLHLARRPARSDLATLVRVDRASVWRAVPLRRGVLVLAVGPLLAAAAGQLTWSQLTVLPGLLASGAALLFGVNVWCLDGRGVRWRESLPVEPALVFAARAWVLAELLAVAAGAALLPAARAGEPAASEVTALLATWLVVVVQVLAACLRWSHQSPAAADLRSPRATPAPPLAMVAYSARLAVGTTLTSLVFALAAHQPDPALVALVAVPFLLWSGLRLAATRRAWLDPVERSRVTAAVAG